MQLVFITTHLSSYPAICGIDPMLSAKTLGVVGAPVFRTAWRVLLFFLLHERTFFFAVANAMPITGAPGKMSATLRNFFGRPFAVGRSKGQHCCRVVEIELRQFSGLSEHDRWHES